MDKISVRDTQLRKFLSLDFGMRLLLFLNALLVLSSAAVAAPNALTYQGRIVKTDGTPLEFNNVSFIFQIADPSGTCVIYEEQVNGYNMANTNGIFDVPIGSGSVGWPLGGSFYVLDAFNNSSAGFNCKGGSTYAPAGSDTRRLKVQFHDGAGWQLISPDNVIRSVPFAGYALSAQKLGTNVAADFLTKAGLPTCGSNTFLSWSGSALTCEPVSGSAGGTVTSITAGSGLTGGTINSSGTIGLGTELSGLNSLSTTGFVKRTGAGAYSTTATINLTSDVSGILPAANGGTGLSALGTGNQVLGVNNAGTASEYKTITAGTGITVSHSAGAITINSTGGNAITALTGDVTASGPGSVAATIANNAITTPKLFSNPGINRLVATDSSTGATLAPLVCTAGQLLAWNASTGWQCTSAVSANTAGSLVSRDASGNFSAGTITADLVGNVTGASSLNVLKAGDTMTGTLNLPANGLVVGTTQLVANSGRVGIGTASPSGTLDVQGGTNATGAGDSINMVAQNAAPGTSALGGAVNITAGDSSVTSGGKYGGAVNIIGGRGAYVSGQTRNGPGGTVTLKGGPGGLGDGGAALVRGGDGGSTAGAAGGPATLMGGTPVEGKGGSVGLSAGSAASANGIGNYPGGGVSINAGSGVGTGVGGNVVLSAGPSAGTGVGGNVVLNSGAGNGAGANAGDIQLNAAPSNFGNGGNISITAGAGNTAGTNAGNITLNPGTGFSGANPGSLLIPLGNIGIATSSPVAKVHVGADPTASANYPLFALGFGAFDGTTAGFYTGNANGTFIGINSTAGYTGDFLNFQINGSPVYRVDSTGLITTSGATNSTGNYSTSGNITTTGTGTITSAGAMIANSGTASTSPTTGSLIVTGGAGISGALYSGSSITANGDISSSASTAATSGSNQNSPNIYLTANYWNGSASAVDQWAIQNILGSGTNPTSTLQFNHSGSSGTTQYAFLNGNVGIGTASPAGILDVEGGTAASGNGSAITFVAQNGGTTGSGGAINITAGNAAAATGGKLGGSINITAGNGAWVSGSSTFAKGGTITIKAGTGGFSASGGNATLQAGAAGSSSGGGSAALLGGAAGTTTGSVGGAATVSGGSNSTNGSGGPAYLTGGNASSIAGSSYSGGKVTITGGWDSANGALTTVQPVYLQPTGGYVGIGVNTLTPPSAPLEVDSTSTATSGTIYNGRFIASVNPAATSSAIYLGSSIGVQTLAGSSAIDTTGSIQGVNGWADHNANNTLIKSIGVTGQSDNQSTGTITKAIGTYGGVFNNSTGTITNGYGLYSEVTQTAGTIATGYGLFTGTIQATNKYSVFASDATAPSYFAGNVGVGTSSPGYPLQVQSAGNSMIDAVTTSNSNAGGFYAQNSSGAGVTMQSWGSACGGSYSGVSCNNLGYIAADAGLTSGLMISSASGPLSFVSNGNLVQTITTSGKVGIGLSGPTYQLQLSTDSAAKPGTSTWTIASDRRLKDIRAPFNRGLDALEGIHPIYFRYKQDNPLQLPSDKEYVGIIAQDAQKAVPESVQTDDQGYLHVTNDAIIWTLLNSVKELYHKTMEHFNAQERSIASVQATKADKTEVQQLKAANAAKDKEIAELKARLDRIEKALETK